MEQNQPLQIDLRNTEPIINSQGGPLFQKGYILRRVSKFITGQGSDGFMPIEVYYDPTNMKILEEFVPSEIKEEFKQNMKTQ